MLKLIRGYLNSGVLTGDVIVETEEGTPQGGPRFVQYADDVAIYVRSAKAAERVKKSVSRFITSKLKLVINEQKSEVSRPWHSKYLGFRITRFMGHILVQL